MRTLLPILMVLTTSVGCATKPVEPTPSRATPARLPQPAMFQISATLTAHLPPQLAAQTGLPRRIEAVWQADAKSEAISLDPLRSRHEGKLTLRLSDGEGKQSLADVKIRVNGEGEGSPTQGLGQVMHRFLDAASMMARPIPPPGVAAGEHKE